MFSFAGMSCDYVLDCFDTSGYKLIWNKEHDHSSLRCENHPVRLHTDLCKVNFGFRDCGSGFTMMIIEDDSYVFIGILNKIKKTLDELATDYPISGFVKKNEKNNSIAILTKVPINEEHKITIDVFGEDGKMINNHSEPSLSVSDLRRRFHLHSGLAESTITINGLTLYQNKYFVSMFINEMTVYSSDPVDIEEAIEIRDWL